MWSGQSHLQWYFRRIWIVTLVMWHLQFMDSDVLYLTYQPLVQHSNPDTLLVFVVQIFTSSLFLTSLIRVITYIQHVLSTHSLFINHNIWATISYSLHWELRLPLIYIFYLSIYILFFLPYLLTITDIPRLAFSRRSWVPLGM